MERLNLITEAASLALHSTVYLAGSNGRIVTTGEIAEELTVSRDHLSKVLQRLSKAGFVKSTRGPRGGFFLARDPEEINLLQIYEAIEGELVSTECLLISPSCQGSGCIFGGLVQKIDRDVRDYFTSTKLSDLISVFKDPKKG